MKKLTKKLGLSRVTTTQLTRTAGGDDTRLGCTSNYGPSCNEGSCYPGCGGGDDGGGGGTTTTDYSFTNCINCFI